jgi:hypothetical protein
MSRPGVAKQASIAAYVDITPGERPQGLRGQSRSPITFPKIKGGLLNDDLSYLEEPHDSHTSNAGKSLKSHIAQALGLIASSVGTASTIATEAAAHAAKARTAPSRDKYLAEKHNALMILQVRVPVHCSRHRRTWRRETRAHRVQARATKARQSLVTAVKFWKTVLSEETDENDPVADLLTASARLYIELREVHAEVAKKLRPLGDLSREAEIVRRKCDEEAQSGAEFTRGVKRRLESDPGTPHSVASTTGARSSAPPEDESGSEEGGEALPRMVAQDVEKVPVALRGTGRDVCGPDSGEAANEGRIR